MFDSAFFLLGEGYASAVESASLFNAATNKVMLEKKRIPSRSLNFFVTLCTSKKDLKK